MKEKITHYVKSFDKKEDQSEAETQRLNAIKNEQASYGG
jgi:hypothetical protein